jgi:hypothetical protein
MCLFWKRGLWHPAPTAIVWLASVFVGDAGISLYGPCSNADEYVMRDSWRLQQSGSYVILKNRFLVLPAAIFIFGSDTQLGDKFLRDILEQVIADLRDRYAQRTVSTILTVREITALTNCISGWSPIVVFTTSLIVDSAWLHVNCLNQCWFNMFRLCIVEITVQVYNVIIVSTGLFCKCKVKLSLCLIN